MPGAVTIQCHRSGHAIHPSLLILISGFIAPGPYRGKRLIYLAVIAGLELAVIVCLLAAFLLERKGLAGLLGDFEAMHQEERARFLAAVQRPDVVQPVHAPKPPTAEELEKRQRVQRDLALVGTVSHAPVKD
jgi:hypothetical protein